MTQQEKEDYVVMVYEFSRQLTEAFTKLFPSKEESDLKKLKEIRDEAAVETLKAKGTTFGAGYRSTDGDEH